MLAFVEWQTTTTTTAKTWASDLFATIVMLTVNVVSMRLDIMQRRYCLLVASFAEHAYSLYDISDIVIIVVVVVVITSIHYADDSRVTGWTAASLGEGDWLRYYFRCRRNQLLLTFVLFVMRLLHITVYTDLMLRYSSYILPNLLIYKPKQVALYSKLCVVVIDSDIGHWISVTDCKQIQWLVIIKIDWLLVYSLFHV